MLSGQSYTIDPDLTLYLIETSFNAFAKRPEPDRAALLRAELPDQGLLCLLMEI